MNSPASSASTNELLLTASGLACVRGGLLLFKGLDLALAPGELVLVRGPNGVGKSSLLRLCAGLLPAAAGELSLAGSVGLCDERLALDAEAPLLRAMQFWVPDTDSAKALQALERLALDHLATVPVRYLSTGQRQRARLARTLLGGAAVWLLDEPANGLDHDSLDRMALVIREHMAAGGAVLATSHIDLPVPADRVVDLAEFAP